MKLEKIEPIPVSPKIHPKTADWYKNIYGSVNRGATFALEFLPAAYHYTLDHELKGKFSQGELGMLIDIMNGTIILDPPQMAGQSILGNLQDAFYLDPGMYEKKWDIPDPDDFISRFKELSHFQKICLEIWITRFWQNYEELSLEEYLNFLAKK